MVEVFKTNVQETMHADTIVTLLREHFPGTRVNFDMHDCDKILRVEGDGLLITDIISLVSGRGFYCRVLN